jgi:hypothetical protein
MKKLTLPLVLLALATSPAGADDDAWYLAFSGDQFEVPLAADRSCMTQSGGVQWGSLYNSCARRIVVHYSVPNTSKTHRKVAFLRVYGGGTGREVSCIFQMEQPWMDTSSSWYGWKSSASVLPPGAAIQRAHLDLGQVWPNVFQPGPQAHMSIVCVLDPYTGIAEGEVWYP